MPCRDPTGFASRVALWALACGTCTTNIMLMLQVSEYLEAQDELDKLAGVALKRIQHFYYKTGVCGVQQLPVFNNLADLSLYITSCNVSSAKLLCWPFLS